jgi:hypothetical protein
MKPRGWLRVAFAEYESFYTPAAFAATTPGSDLFLSRMREGPIWVATQWGKVIGTLRMRANLLAEPALRGW